MHYIDPAKREVLVGVSALAALALSACSGQPDANPKPSATATLLNHKEVADALDALSGAVSDLEASVGGFDSEDWKDVVPEVQSATASVSNALSSLKAQMAGQAPD